MVYCFFLSSHNVPTVEWLTLIFKLTSSSKRINGLCILGAFDRYLRICLVDTTLIRKLGLAL